MRRFILESLFRLRADRLTRLAHRHKAIVLAYHGFTDRATHPGIENSQGKHLPVEAFRSQLAYLQRHYRVLPLETLIAAFETGAPLPARSLAITIDDGYRSNYTLAYPVLREYGLPATIFLTTGFLDEGDLQWSDRIEHALNRTTESRLELTIGRDTFVARLDDMRERLACDRRLRTLLKVVPQETRGAIVDDLEQRLGQRLRDAADAPAIYQPLAWAEVREMQQSGLMTFGSHTVSHFILTRCDPARAKDELARSRHRIETETGVPCRLFCYPNGQVGCFDAATRAMLLEAGYTGGLTTVYGMNDRRSDVLALKRLYANKPGMARFALTVSGVMGVLDGVERAALPRKKGQA
jgi:peptidoglycan/xylan/chitin deacetylase (PgdA/CDA1 family)